MELTDKQERFCREYAIDFNGTQAAIRAGYSKKTAQQISDQNLSKLVIQKFIAEIQKPIIEDLNLKQVDVLKEYMKIGFSNIQDYIKQGFEIDDIVKLERDKAAAIESIQVTTSETEYGVTRSVKFKLYSKTAALDSLGKHLGIYEADNKQKPVIKQEIDYSKLTDEQLAVIASLPVTGKEGVV